MAAQAAVTIAHDRVPGRLRLRIPALHRRPPLARRLERLCAGLAGVHAATASPLTASLLLRHATDYPADTLCRAVAGFLAELTGQPPPPASPARPPVPRPPWHSLSAEQTLHALGITAGEGLSDARARQRLAAEGPNRLGADRVRSPLDLLLGQVATLPVALLGVSAGISVATGGLADAGIILGVVLINSAIGYATERQAERTIRGLNHVTPPQATVTRDGQARVIPGDQLARGDLVRLSAGATVPADIRLLHVHRFSVDESSLTGESLPVEKQALFQAEAAAPLSERRNMAYMGTQATGGSARGVVVATGTATEIGQVKALLGSAETPDTPVQRQLDDLGRTLALISGGVCVGVFGLGVLRGQGLLPMLKGAVSLAVAAVPEGLPTVATTTLALGIRDMRRRQAAVRRLGAVETLGSVQVLCLDKTGTLTQNRMSLVAARAGGQGFTVSDGRLRAGEATAADAEEPLLRPLLETVTLCTESETAGGGEPGEQGGSATERALLEGAAAAGVDAAALWRQYPLVRRHHRAEGRPYMTTLHDGGAGRRLLAVKGNPAEVLARCTTRRTVAGTEPLDAARRRAITGANEDLAAEGLRVLGVARRWLAADAEAATAGLEWLGLVGLADPLRPGMAEVIRQFHRAGIETVMITGDQSATAYKIGRELGLAGERPLEVLDSRHLEKMDPEVLAGVVGRVHVFSRVSPAHKLRIVQAFQKAGRVVAMTGDGINDGPALKAADIGVAMGASGTEVARSVADIVLENDQLATMAAAVRQGRATYDNIRKTIRFLLATNFSEIQVMAAGTALGWGNVLSPMQLLWINLVTDIFPGLALSLEAPDADLLDRPPRDPDRPVISRHDLGRISLEAATITAGSLGAYLAARWRYGAGPAAGTHLFTTLTTAQLLHTLSARSEQRTLFRRHRANPYLTWALAGSLGAQGLAAALPPLRRLLGTTPIHGRDALTIAAGAGLPLLVNEATKGRSPPAVTTREEGR